MSTDEMMHAALKAVEPLARLELPTKPQGNAGFYSIFHADIRAAQAFVAEVRRDKGLADRDPR